jgi:quercetin dioxygenase-like cupin family protein
LGFPVYDYREDVRNVLVTPQIRSRFLRMEPGQESGVHTHDLGHEVFLVLEGRAEFTIDGETEEVGPGQMCVALVDQMHGLRVIGDEPMTLYLSVTPHIQPTHTFWDEQGGRLPNRFASPGAYDVETDTATPFPKLMDRLVKATRDVADAAGGAAYLAGHQSATIAKAVADGDATESAVSRDAIWDALIRVFRTSAELAVLWNDVAPRAGAGR